MIESLPYNILEIIIQELELAGESGRKAVLACSSTCRAFVHPCRAHLFSRIDLYWANRWAQDIGQFADLLLQDPSLADHVRWLDCGLEGTDDMVRVLLQLKNICSLTLHGSSHGRKASSPGMQQALIHLFGLPSLTFIKLSARLPGEGLPADLLSSCGNLVDLRLNSNNPFTSASCRTILGTPPRLLSLHTEKSTVALKSLLDIKRSDALPIVDLSHLQTLVIGCITHEDFNLMEKILSVTRKLVKLECHVLPDVTHHKLARMLDIKSLPTLRSISITLDFLGDIEDPFSGLIEELEEMGYERNNCLQELSLLVRVWPWSVFSFVDRDWKKLDNILGDPSAFQCLKIFTFKFILKTFSEEQFQSDAKEQLKKFEDMKTRQLTRLSSQERPERDFNFSVELDVISIDPGLRARLSMFI
ncbi:hypothetical protein B0H34DRAFT_110057 [Crassisporium funariophilum]|nr:hypothetical protein B0H34DRAFT_110057 [Crassisporium funariophilum]